MFEKIVLKRSPSGSSISAGELAEALIFYRNVHLILDYSSLRDLVQSIRMEGVLNLLRRENVTAVYCDDAPVVMTEAVGAIQYHKLTTFTFASGPDDEPSNTREKRVEHLLRNSGYSRKISEQLAQKFSDIVPSRLLTSEYFVKGGLIKAGESDLNEKGFLEQATRELFSGFGALPFPDELKLDVIQSSADFIVFSNLNFIAINSYLSERFPHVGEMNHARVLSEILTARTDIHMAAKYGGEFYTSDSSSKIIQLRDKNLLQKLGIDKNEISQLNEIVLDAYPSIKEVINDREKTFDEFLEILDRSQRFRDWIHGVAPDKKLVAEYFSSISAEGWISKTPTKALRYILGGLIGAVEPTTGLALAAADTFLLDKYLAGWRPNHFVDGTLKPFLTD